MRVWLRGKIRGARALALSLYASFLLLIVRILGLFLTRLVKHCMELTLYLESLRPKPSVTYLPLAIPQKPSPGPVRVNNVVTFRAPKNSTEIQ